MVAKDRMSFTWVASIIGIIVGGLIFFWTMFKSFNDRNATTTFISLLEEKWVIIALGVYLATVNSFLLRCESQHEELN